MSVIEQVVTEQDVRNHAADLLEEFGWCQCVEAKGPDGKGLAWDDAGAVEFCGRTALWRARRELRYGNEIDFGDLVKFNDTPGRTKAEVVARLRGTGG